MKNASLKWYKATSSEEFQFLLKKKKVDLYYLFISVPIWFPANIFMLLFDFIEKKKISEN